MSEKRVVRILYGEGGYDSTKPNNNIIKQETEVVSDEQLYQEQLGKEFNDYHIHVINMLNKWEQQQSQQKDELLKMLAKQMLWKDGWLKFGLLEE